MATLFIIVKIWKQPGCPSVKKKKTTTLHSDSGILFGAYRKWVIKPWRHGGNLNVNSWVIEANLKRLRIA